MQDDGLERALDRADFALRRIVRSLDNRQSTQPAPVDTSREDAIRSRLREAVAELDQLIREAQD